MAAFRRIPALVLTMAFVLVPALLAGAAGAATADDLAAAKATLADARAAAQSAASAFADQEAKVAETQNHIDDLRATIDKQKARAGALKEIATQRALYAYTHKDDQVDLLVGSGDEISAGLPDEEPKDKKDEKKKDGKKGDTENRYLMVSASYDEALVGPVPEFLAVTV
jgi:predicted  nucleic acid-binding Zn-ribbon protein